MKLQDPMMAVQQILLKGNCPYINCIIQILLKGNCPHINCIIQSSYEWVVIVFLLLQTGFYQQTNALVFVFYTVNIKQTSAEILGQNDACCTSFNPNDLYTLTMESFK